MSRKLILLAICLMMLLSSLTSLMARADGGSRIEPVIVSDDIALTALRAETLEGLRALLDPNLSQKERVDRVSELAKKANEQMDRLITNKQVNGDDYLNAASVYSQTYNLVSGAVVLAGMQANQQGQIGYKDCSQTKGVLRGNYVFNPPPNNKPTDTDNLLESIRRLMCAEKK